MSSIQFVNRGQIGEQTLRGIEDDIDDHNF